MKLWPFGGNVRLPESVGLEACTLCQLDCVGCYMRRSESGYCGVGAGYLKFENFAKFLKMNPFVKKIELANNGEVFLNPDLLKIMEYAHRHNVKLSANGGVNFNDVSDEVMEGMVRHEFQSLNIAIDGSSQEAYAKYRRGGVFEKVIANIKKLNRYKRLYNSFFPELRWQYVIFESNDSIEEIRRAKAMASELGMHIGFSRDHNGYVPSDTAMIERETELVYRPDTMVEMTDISGRFLPCFFLWKSPFVNWNGWFLGCCGNYRDELSGMNAFELSLEKILNSKIVLNTKKNVMNCNARKDSLCFHDGHYCIFYNEMAKSGRFITKAELKKVYWL